MFTEGGYPVKIKKYRGASMQGTCRILCFLQKSGEAVILNNRGMGRDGASIQVRIADQSLFHKLDGLSENLKSRILHAGDCGFCSPKCEGKRYVFSYGEKDYVKCRYLCSLACYGCWK